jgi:trans-aconitate 2-methyltransferase
LRLRPALDLLSQVPDLPSPGDVIDLGCGDGAVGTDLRLRSGKRRLLGVDSSAAMLGRAETTGIYDALFQGDVAHWSPPAPPALVFSNAVLHWLPDHGALMPRLAGWLAPGGILAVQMPVQHAAPSHALLRDTAARLFPDRFDFSTWQPQVSEPAFYARLLAPLGAVNVWVTEYLQRLDPVADGHPIRHFTQSTAMRPIAEKLTGDEQAAFVEEYDAALQTAYPSDPDGSVLFGFRRLFFVLTLAG